MKNTYTVPEDRREDILKAIARNQKKAEKYGSPLIAEYGEPYAVVVPVFGLDPATHVMYEKDKIMVEVFDLTIESEIIRKEGYTVAAKIEHLDEGNIVTLIDGKGRAEWNTMKPFCEHCRGNHGQRLTFIVRHDDGSEKQVGRTCLKEYCGIDPQAIGSLNEIRAILEQDDIRSYDFESRPVPRAYRTIDAVALAFRLQKEFGYVSASQPGSNKVKLSNLMKQNERPTAEELAEAEKLMEVVLAMDDDTAFQSSLNNVRTLLQCGYCKADNFGYIACSPLMFQKHMNWRKKQEEREAAKMVERQTSGFVGEIGQRLVVDVADLTLLTSWEGEWGYTYLYKIIDVMGNVLIWYASRCIDEAKKLRATIKDHSERDGVKQTIVTRCSVVA